MTVGRKRILVVDDNDVVRETLREFLSQAYTVDGASCASTALDVLSRQPADAILLDVRMPGSDGLSLLESIRRVGIDVPVFVMTGYDSPEHAARARRSGAVAYLKKPVDLRELDQRLADALHVPRVLDS